VQGERRGHEAAAGQQDPAAADAVGDGSGDEGHHAEHDGVHGHERAERGLGDAELLADAREDGRDEHDLAARREDQQPEGEQDEAPPRPSETLTGSSSSAGPRSICRAMQPPCSSSVPRT
jgi:hypothetical protein